MSIKDRVLEKHKKQNKFFTNKSKKKLKEIHKQYTKEFNKLLEDFLKKHKLTHEEFYIEIQCPELSIGEYWEQVVNDFIGDFESKYKNIEIEHNEDYLLIRIFGGTYTLELTQGKYWNLEFPEFEYAIHLTLQEVMEEIEKFEKNKMFFDTLGGFENNERIRIIDISHWKKFKQSLCSENGEDCGIPNGIT